MIAPHDMKQVEVEAIQEHSPAGIRRYKMGETYKISESAARLLIAAKFVKLRTSESQSETAKESKRHYNRRDLRAED